MEKLGKIFGSNNRVKIMRLFLFNTDISFDIDDVVKRSIIKRENARKELNLLTKIGFLKKKSFTKKVLQKKTKKNPEDRFKTKKVNEWIINYNFSLVEPLKFLIESELINERELSNKIKKTGSIKLLALSGLFLQDIDRKIDILIVGDKIKRNVLDSEIIKIEAEIGQELSYAVFDTEEFNYRADMNDKLIRDVLENTNRILINKLY